MTRARSSVPLRFGAGLGAIGVAALTVTGCGFESRKQRAQLLVHAARELERSRTGQGVLVLRVRTEKSSQGFNSVAGGRRGISAPPVVLQLDFVRRRALAKGTAGQQVTSVTSVTPGRPTGAAVPGAGRPGAAMPSAVFLGPVVFLQRPGAAEGSDSQFGVRAWSKLDFAKVGKKDSNTLGEIGVVNPINPTYLLQLLAGTLSGSVRRLGTETVNGSATTHYEMSVDRAKAFARLGDRDRQAVDKAFKSDDVKGSVYKHAEVWIDAGGLPRRFVLRLHQEIDSDNVFGVTYTLELTSLGTPVEIRPPGSDATAEVTSLNALLSSARS